MSSSSFFFSDFTFYKEVLCFITFILSLCSNTLTLESIFEYIPQKLKKSMVISKCHPGNWLHVLFSFFIRGCYVMLCILYLKSMHKIVYNKKLINIDWLMLHSLQETKCDASLLLLLLQPTQTKFKQQQPQQQQKTTQFQYENSTKASRLHFSDLQ